MYTPDEIKRPTNRTKVYHFEKTRCFFEVAETTAIASPIADVKKTASASEYPAISDPSHMDINTNGNSWLIIALPDMILHYGASLLNPPNARDALTLQPAASAPHDHLSALRFPNRIPLSSRPRSWV